jgi:CheY-like chemotaxis protein/anti-sigma regulatory factor (Ser/Thr protein kinase)
MALADRNNERSMPPEANMENPSTGPTQAPPANSVLIVDDNPMDRHMAGSIVQKIPGWQASFAGDGNEALEQIARQKPDVVLTDMLMPEMDGLQLVQAIRAKYPLIPVILMTAHGSEDLAIQALQRGAASYVPKKALQRELAETLDQVVSASRTRIQEQRLLTRLDAFEVRFTLDNDTSLIPALVSHIEEDISRLRLCEPGSLVLLGVAMHEALTNAMHHGNLELCSEMRETDERQYYKLGQDRRTQEPYSARKVYVSARFTREELIFKVRDEGKGFDPASLPDPIDPINLGKVSGRGLLLIHTFMDRVAHNDVGNEITMTKRVA